MPRSRALPPGHRNGLGAAEISPTKSNHTPNVRLTTLAGRVLIRYSGTENKARVMVEGEEERAVTDFANALAATLKESLAAG